MKRAVPANGSPVKAGLIREVPVFPLPHDLHGDVVPLQKVELLERRVVRTDMEGLVGNQAPGAGVSAGRGASDGVG